MSNGGAMYRHHDGLGVMVEMVLTGLAAIVIYFLFEYWISRR